jgi:hypothetical protein
MEALGRREWMDVVLGAEDHGGVVVFKKFDTCEPIKQPWQAIKLWIPVDDEEPSLHQQDAPTPTNPRGIPLDDGRILVLDAD